ncbi:MAG: hypothetical protein D6715_02840 [Calditrichaeota bacterium]|nr:MAG: hypothetical protein D6715_02840 [Calditrichota bacterium]
MPNFVVKRLERLGKSCLNSILLAGRKPLPPAAVVPERLRRIGVFRLDQRIGNGILLLPLLQAIRHGCPQAELHVLVHAPVAELFQEAARDLNLTIWPYRQARLLRKPWRLVGLLRAWRGLQLDVLLSASNPDHFSLSQGLWARWCRARCGVGFRRGAADRVYHRTVETPPDLPYALALVRLWQDIQPEAAPQPAYLKVPEQRVEAIRSRYPQLTGGVCLWLGATGRKPLPGWLVEKLYQALPRIFGLPLRVMAGPADQKVVGSLPTPLRQRVHLWEEPLTETAALFSTFQLFVSGDTGPRHLAVALRVPTVGIFHHSNMHQYGTAGDQRHRTIQLTGNRLRDWRQVEAELKRMGAIVAHPAGS